MPLHDDEPLEDLLARSRDHAQQFDVTTRAHDPPFAQASLFYPDDMGEWQAAIYLLTGSEKSGMRWATTCSPIQSIAPVIDELAQPHRAWSSSEDGVMQCAAHFWDVGRYPATFPYSSSSTPLLCHLCKRLTPALPCDRGGER